MKIYNSKTDKLETFQPKNEKKLNMYVCGPTVYSDIHIGNARPIIFFDVVARYFEAIGYKVNYTSNITDVDDKIINEAKKRGITEQQLVDQTTERFLKVLSELNVRKFDHQPTVTESMDDIITFIEELIQLGYAYEVEGDVYFRIGKIAQYGEISNRNLEELIDGKRIEVNTKKENPQDFTLWKETQEGVKWTSPWSKGRPGWHTECVVMIRSIYNKETIDIHGGGMDLKFPHHENENAQSCACGTNLANYWMHNGFINIDNTKMSKSLGNVFNAQEFIDNYGANVLRLVMLQTNYRQPINITQEFIDQTKKLNDKFARVMKDVERSDVSGDNALISKFNEILANDLNTANGISFLLENIKGEINLEQQELLVYGLGILGLNFAKEDVVIPNEVKLLIEKRAQAKKDKDFSKADECRLEIENLGYEIFDTRQGVECKKMKKN